MRLCFFSICFLLTHPVFSWPAFKVLVFTKTAGFQHASIPDGIAAINALGLQYNFAVDQTNDSASFTSANLSQYAAVIFLNTTGDVLGAAEETAFQQYIQAGGGFAGIHSATDTEYGWPWYGELVGTYFLNHPAIQSATLHREDSVHVSTSGLPSSFVSTDEWYNFATPFPSNLNVLLTIDETTYSGGSMGSFHPISWYHYYDGGRAFYTAIGHTSEIYSDPLFRQHILGGIFWAANANVSVEELPEKELLNAYPNPGTGIFRLVFQSAQNVKSITVHDFCGKQIIELPNITGSQHEINLGGFSKGVFSVKVIQENRVFTLKIVLM
jgi:uncharacterized protein